MALVFTGTVANQPTLNNTPINPFAAVVLTDTNGATDTASIQLGNNGVSGTLSGAGLIVGANGLYTLASAPTATIQAELRALVFTPTEEPPNTAVTTTMALSGVSSTGGGPVLASPAPSVIDFVAALSTTISGTVADQRTTNSTVFDPFSGVTVTNPNAGALDTMTIQLSNLGLTGTLAAAIPGDLTSNGGGLYTVNAVTAAAITSILDTLVFTPNPVAPLGGITPTTFTLQDTSNGVGAPVTINADTSATNTLPTASILFQADDGHATIWQLNGTNLIGGGIGMFDGAAAQPGTSWAAIGMGNFGGGLTPSSDILLQNSDGQVATWQMNGTNVVDAGVTTVAGAEVNPGMSWTGVGTGQFSHNVSGQSDILLQNADSSVAIWNMAGSAITGSGLATIGVGGAIADPGTDWTAVGSGSFIAGDLFSDSILLQSASTGDVAIWNMGGADGTTIVSSGLATVGGVTATPGADWKAIGTGDFTATGQNDIVFQNSTTSQIAIWGMGGVDGTTVGTSGLASVGGATATPGLDWKAIGTGGIGDSSILFQNTSSGQTATWEMGGPGGTSIIASGLTSANTGPTLHAVGLTGAAALV